MKYTETLLQQLVMVNGIFFVAFLQRNEPSFFHEPLPGMSGLEGWLNDIHPDRGVSYAPRAAPGIRSLRGGSACCDAYGKTFPSNAPSFRGEVKT